jgi:hypothetical protein
MQSNASDYEVHHSPPPRTTSHSGRCIYNVGTRDCANFSLAGLHAEIARFCSIARFGK